MGIATCLVIIGCMACDKLNLGLKTSVYLVNDSDAYTWYTTDDDYNESGPPAYVVFKDIDYTNGTNLN